MSRLPYPQLLSTIFFNFHFLIVLKYNTKRQFMLMPSFGGTIICHMIGNNIRADTLCTLGLCHEALSVGHQGQMIFPSMFMFDRFPANLTLTAGLLLFIYHLHCTCFEPVLVNLHNHKHIITYTSSTFSQYNPIYLTLMVIWICCCMTFIEIHFILNRSEDI